MTTETRDHRAHAAELKFLVAPDVGADIRAWIRTELTPDPHGTGAFADEYSTTTLYADTPAWDVYLRHGSYGRSKYRVRRYGTSDVVFLERKLRTAALLSKRRTIIPIDALGQWGPGHWFHERLTARGLTPVCQVSYDRTARVTATPYGIARLTVDSGLRAQPACAWEYDETPRYQSVLTGAEILELKFMVAMPAVFKRLIETFGLAPDSVSKYRLSVAALNLATAAIPAQTGAV